MSQDNQKQSTINCNRHPNIFPGFLNSSNFDKHVDIGRYYEKCGENPENDVLEININSPESIICKSIKYTIRIRFMKYA